SLVAASVAADSSQILIRTDVDNTVRWKPGERLEQLFEQRCDQLPANQVAVIAEEIALTFRELDNRANQAARYLIDQGLKAGDRVALLFDKTINRYVGLLAVLKVGAAYVPLDSSFPADRMGFILEDAGVKAIVSESQYRAKFAELALPQIFLDSAQQEIAAKPTALHADDEKSGASRPLSHADRNTGAQCGPELGA